MAKSRKRRGRNKITTVKQNAPSVSEPRPTVPIQEPLHHVSHTAKTEELEEAFRICTVLLMEDSAELSELTSKLVDYTGAGLRPRFHAINPESIRDILASKKPSISHDDQATVALAIKQRLQELKAKGVQEKLQKQETQEFGVDGKRSKDKISTTRASDDLSTIFITSRKRYSDDDITEKTKSSGGGDAKARKKKRKSKTKRGDTESSGSETSSRSRSKSKKRKKLKDTSKNSENATKSEDEKTMGNLNELSDTNPSDAQSVRKKTKKQDKKSTGSSSSKRGSKKRKHKSKKNKKKSKGKMKNKIQKPVLLSPSLTFPSPRNSTMKKRGEIKLPGFELQDDSPRDGPDMYVLLHGFYDPHLLAALHKVAAPIDGVLMLTQSKIDKKNLSVTDIEETIPGAFMPQNVLPEYKQEILAAMHPSHDSQTGNIVNKFWFNMAQMINSADPSSFIHDVALFQSEVPKPLPNRADGEEALVYYHAKLLDEIAARLYEMGVLTCWFQCYKNATSAKELPSSDIEQSASLYQDFLSIIPAECVTVPLIMEAMLMQVIEAIDGPKYPPNKKTPSISNIDPAVFTHNIIGTTRGRYQQSTSNLEYEIDEYAQGREKIQSLPNAKPLYKLQEEYGEHDLEEYDGDGQHPPLNFRKDRNRYRPYLSSLYYKENKLNLCTPPLSPSEAGPKFQTTTLIDSHDFAGIRACHLENDFAVLIASNEVAGTFTSIRNYLWDSLPEFDETLHAKFQANLTQFMHFLPWEEFDLNDMFFILHLLLAAGTEKCILRDQDQDASAEGLHNDPYCCDGMHNRFKSLLAIYNKDELEDESLDFSKNYLAVADNSRFLLGGTSRSTFDVIAPKSAKLNVHHKDQKRDEMRKKSLGITLNATEDEVNYLLQPGVSDFPLPDSYVRKSHHQINPTVASKNFTISNKSHQLLEPSPRQYGCNLPTGEISEPDVHHAIRFGPTKTQSYGIQDFSLKDNSESLSNHMHSEDTESTLKYLLNCPELIRIQETGALEFPRYRHSTELCPGISASPNSINIIQKLHQWNHVESMDPVQMVQALYQASSTYLSMERVYCPIYDTILYVFHNPLPLSLTAQDSNLVKLKTLPGLQHFLDYTINDQDVFKFVMDCEKSKGLNPVQTLSVETLMRLIPEDQWLLIPSIKYTLKKMRQKAEEFTLETTDDEEDATADAQEEVNSAQSTLIKAREKKRQRKRIQLSDDEPRPDDDGYKSQTDYSTDASNLTNPRRKPRKDKTKKNKTESGTSASEKELTVKKRKKKSKKNPGKEGSETSGSESEAATDSTSKKAKKPSKGKSKKKSKKGSKKKGKSKVEKSSSPEAINSLQEEPETPLPILTPQVGSDNEKDFHSQSRDGRKKQSFIKHLDDVKRFEVHDLGKRHIITTSDDFHLFPMDGSVIFYNVSTIEPDYRMMQLKITKLGCTTVFYPYFFPHDAQIDSKSFVLVPHFHSVTPDGTIMAFKDLRQVKPLNKQQVQESKHLIREEQYGEDFGPHSYSSIPEAPEYPLTEAFNFHDIVFMDENDASMLLSKLKAFEAVQQKNSATNDQETEEEEIADQVQNILTPPPDVATAANQKSAKEASSEKGQKKKKKKSKNKSKPKSRKRKLKSKKSPKSTTSEEDSGDSKSKSKKRRGRQGKKKFKNKSKSKSKNKKRGKNKSAKMESPQSEPPQPISSRNENEEEEEGEQEVEIPMLPPPGKDGGNWHYSSSDETDAEDIRSHYPSSINFQFGWNKAVHQLTPLTHELKITLPTGLQIQVSDSPGPPLTREVKQAYVSSGNSASPHVPDETARYYTQNGTVVRFLTNGLVQTLNARGVTTNFSKLWAEVPNGQLTDDLLQNYNKSRSVKVFKGDTIMPTGEFWHISRGRRTKHDPLYVFTSETMPNGELFRRRQDGTIYIHRSDGTCITHYPDGTRFTSRLVIEHEAKDPDLESWDVIGLRYMIEHPNYAPVIFNNLSGNVHIRLPKGEWVRVFSDGFIRVNLDQNYRLGVDGLEAILSSPTIEASGEQVPNATAVKLYHRPVESVQSFLKITKLNLNSILEPIPPPTSMSDPDLQPIPHLKSKSTHTRLSHAGPRTSVLMEKNLRMSDGSSPTQSAIFTNGKLRSPLVDEDVAAPHSVVTIAAPHASFIRTDKDGVHDAEGDQYNKLRFDPNLPDPTSSQPFDLMQFLAFSDLWTICKSIDSFNNRFALDIFGNTVVDKHVDLKSHFVPNPATSVNLKEPYPQGVEKVVPSKVSCKIPGTHSGILDKTSTSHMLDRLTRMVSSPVDTSNYSFENSPRVFAVKRDLSGFEFLQSHKVFSILEKAMKNSSAITTDIQPSKSRKYITITEEVNEKLNPYGFWKRSYREPTFRPTTICNKDMKPASPLELRWFAYILTNAHKNRGNYLPSPKDRYLQKKQEEEEANAKLKLQAQDAALELVKELEKEANDKLEEVLKTEEVQVGKPKRATSKKKKGKEGQQKEKEKRRKQKGIAVKEPGVEIDKDENKPVAEPESKNDGNEEIKDEKSENNVASTTVTGRKVKKSSKTKKGKKSRGRKNKTVDKGNHTGSEDDGKVGKSRSTKGKKNKGKSKGKSKNNQNKKAQKEEELHPIVSDDEEEETPLDVPDDVVPPLEDFNQRPVNKIGKNYPGDYPDNIPDIRGLYDTDKKSETEKLVQPYLHSSRSNLSPKAVIVRKLMEIPTMDPELQNIIITASRLYANFIKSLIDKREQLTMPEDPRSHEEVVEAELVKKEFAAFNLQTLHTYEQDRGKSLDLCL